MTLQRIQQAFERTDFVGGKVRIAHDSQDALVAQQGHYVFAVAG